MTERAILHIDMNNFYASVECMLNPELKPFPIAVCGSQEERHGIVLAKNYAAKAKGVSTGEAIWQAKQKCPNLVIVPPHYDQYMKFSKLAREIYGRYTDLIEPFGMDEVWADVTGSQRAMGTPLHMAEEIKETIKYELGLTVSIGVSFNKIFAKLGSDMKKPDAITVINKETFREQIWDLPASDMLGVGRATEKKLSSVGIRTIGQIAQFPCDFFQRRLGKCGIDIWRFANGMDTSKVTVRDIEAPDKTVGHGMTALQDLEDDAEVWKFILELCQDIGHRLYVFNKKATGMLNLSESRQPHLSDSRLTVTVTNGKQPSDRLSETIPISDVCCLIAKPEVSSAPVMTLISSKTSAFASKTYARIQIDSQRWSQKAFSFTKLWKRNRSNS